MLKIEYRKLYTKKKKTTVDLSDFLGQQLCETMYESGELETLSEKISNVIKFQCKLIETLYKKRILNFQTLKELLHNDSYEITGIIEEEEDE